MASGAPLLTPGTLWLSVLERTDRALRRGAIQSIPTTSEIIEQDGVAFQVRVVHALEHEQEAKAAQLKVNPFLPYEPDLFVADLSPTHVVLLNKFNVVDHHLLIVTRAFEDQETLLTREDCEALMIALAEIDGLAFYNAGPLAGASQPHKHLQIIPLSAPPGPRLPIDRLLEAVGLRAPTGTVPGFPFVHAYMPMDPRWLGAGRDGAVAVQTAYRMLLEAVHLPVEPAIGGLERTGPYNLLATRRWLLLVPRSEEYFEGISINALGFAGMVLVKDEAHLAILRRNGPMTALKEVTKVQNL